jgi:hypothetical protein
MEQPSSVQIWSAIGPDANAKRPTLQPILRKAMGIPLSVSFPPLRSMQKMAISFV